jgi:hypothetical protein
MKKFNLTNMWRKQLNKSEMSFFTQLCWQREKTDENQYWWEYRETQYLKHYWLKCNIGYILLKGQCISNNLKFIFQSFNSPARMLAFRYTHTGAQSKAKWPLPGDWLNMFQDIHTIEFMCFLKKKEHELT